MNFGMLKILGDSVKLLTALPFSNLIGISKNEFPIMTTSSWNEEKDDILERANWLCNKIIKSPEELVSDMPSAIGLKYQGQWAIYCCSMLAHALANISFLYPEKKSKVPFLIAKLIEIVNTPTIRYYDTCEWKEDAMDTLSGEKHHMTYLSILAWMISNYKLVGGDDRYDSIYVTICETLNRRMLKSKYNLNLLSFPKKEIFLPDMLVTIIALHNYSRIFDNRYEDTVNRWLNNAKTMWIHKSTGLLAGRLPGASCYKKSMTIRGSHTALNCSYLSLIDEGFAVEQYEKMKIVLKKKASIMGITVCGVKEFLRKEPVFTFQRGDAGLIIQGISAGGTAFALGAATYFEDWEFRSQLLNTAEKAGRTEKKHRMRHYRLGEIFMVGEATTLAMRTNIRR